MVQPVASIVSVANANLLAPGVTYACSMVAITCGPCFTDASCFDYFLRRLLGRASSYRVVVHAYCLLPNEVMVIATPGTPRGIANLLHSVATCYGDYFALRFRRSARVFGTRLHARVLARSGAVIEAQRFLERQGINNQQDLCPGSYHWSSYSDHALGAGRAPLVLHPAWRTLIPTGNIAPAAYRAQLASPIPARRYACLQQLLRAASCKSIQKQATSNTRQPG